MKIVIAPDSFKESLTAKEVGKEIEAGFREIFPEAQYQIVPVADGGEGTVQAMIDALAGTPRSIQVVGPLGSSVSASFGLADENRIAIIEMAAASGLELVPPAQRNPLATTSFGTGQIIRDALDEGARKFVIGIGGSATNDGGAGMLQALGVKLLDKDGNSLGPGGAALADLDRIDVSEMDPRISECHIDVACDVTNPLTGPEGASAVFGPQKGATPAMVEILDSGLKKFAEVLRRDLGKDVERTPGAGAAGGMGAALMAVLGGRLRPGSEVITETIGLDAAVANADLVITGEGRIDGQTVFGKTPIGVARVAARHRVPVIGIGGCLANDASAVHAYGISAVFSTVRKACSLDEALESARFNVRNVARNIAAAVRLGQQLHPACL